MFFFTLIKETHNYNTRLSSRMTYALPKTRTNYGIFNIRYQGAKIWNAINDNIKLLSLKDFKKRLKLGIPTGRVPTSKHWHSCAPRKKW